MSQLKHSASVSVLLIAGALAGGEVHGAGFQITEQSVTGLGRAFAGGSIAADDASAVVYNPADMMLIPEDYRFHIGVNGIKLRAKFKARGDSALNVGELLSKPISGDGSKDGGDLIPVPTFSFVSRINDRLKVGLGANALFGLETDYGRQWVGRYVASKSTLTTLDINPSLAYRLSDNLSLGAGLSAVYADTQLTQATPDTDPLSLIFSPSITPEDDGKIKLSGTDWGFGYNLGLTYEFDETARVGLSFRSKVELDFDDEDLELTRPGEPTLKTKGDAKIDLPETVWLEGYKRFSHWALLGHVRWTKWDRFDELVVESKGAAEALRKEGLPVQGDVLQKVPFNWDNVWTVGLGVHYYYGSSWLFRAGAAYDQAPTPSAKFRNPRVPDTDRYWVSIGASYRPAQIPGLSVDFGWSHLFTETGKINYNLEIINGTGLSTNLKGELEKDNGQDLVGLQATYSF